MLVLVAQMRIDPWHDEAMLLANLLIPDLNLFAPLPQYEQAGPVGYLWIARVLLTLTGSEPPYAVLRLLSAFFFAAGTGVLLASQPLRSRPVAALIFAAIICGSSLIWSYTFEIKHYSAEFFASALVLVVGLPLASSDRVATFVRFLVAVLIGGLLSFTLPVVVAGLLGGIAVVRLAEGGSARSGLSLPFILTGATALAYLFILYVFLNKELVIYQLSAYAHVYGRGAPSDLVGILIARTIGLLDVATFMFGSAMPEAIRQALVDLGMPLSLSYHLVRLLAVVIVAGALWMAMIEAPDVGAVGISIMLVVAVLGLGGALQIASARHTIFLSPLAALIFTFSLTYLLDRLLPGRPSEILSGILLVSSLVLGVNHGLNRETQEITKLLVHIRDTRADAPVWVFGGAQPALRVLSPPPARVLGMFDPTSAKIAWQVRGGEVRSIATSEIPWQVNPDYPQTIANLASGEKALWLLFSNDGLIPDRSAFLAVAEKAIGACVHPLESWASALYFCEEKGDAAAIGRAADR
ncbi:hypothetical protein CX676_14055 [Paracoccus zhejiangensis]|uniref:Glycosyltransferase RgtA/B/C/D-like domain-containing protein n=2 Tax=Paracoccus zhejiangensis TaxID=1077935 RepID=A0A2H5F0S5_9RHOB|nr:hypothetical protein CX676_14055 [Paracoccus zhejiangensis]